MKMRETFKNIGLQIYERRKLATIKQERRKVSRFKLSPFLAIPAVLLLCVLIGVFYLREPELDAAVIVKTEDPSNQTAIADAQKIFEAFYSKNQEQIKKLTKNLDPHGSGSCKEILENVGWLDFSKAYVLSPKLNLSKKYVYIPCVDGKKVQFALRKKGDDFILQGVYLLNK